MLVALMIDTVNGLTCHIAAGPGVTIHRTPPRASIPSMDLEDLTDLWGVSSATRMGFMPVNQLTPIALHRATPQNSRLPTVFNCISNLERMSEPHHLPATVATVATAEAEGETATKAEMAPLAPQRLHTRAELLKALDDRGGDPIVLLFGAKACRTCRRLLPTLAQLGRRASARVYYVYYDTTTQHLFVEHAISVTPTVHVYDGTSGALLEHGVYYSAAHLSHLSRVLETAVAA